MSAELITIADTSGCEYGVDIAKAFLGGILLDNRKLAICLDECLPPLEQLRPPDAKPADKREPLFTHPANEETWQAILALMQKHSGVDLTMLGSYLNDIGRYEAVGGGPYLAALEDEIISTLYLTDYARILADKWRRRSMLRVAESIAQSARKAEEKPEEFALSAMTSLATLAEAKDKAKPEAIGDLLAKTMGEIETRREAASENGGVIGIRTGHQWIDQYTTGLRPGQLVIIAARPSVGKTSLALQMAHGIAKWSGGAVAFYSLEMGKDELSERLLGVVARVNINQIRNGTISGADHERAVSAAIDLQNYLIAVDDRTDAPIEILKSRIEQENAKHHLKAIIVDYLQLIPAPPDDKQNRAQQVADITRGLKLIAKSFGVPVIALSQLSREGVKEKTRPELHHLRESGAIEQDADLVVFLHRPDLALENAEIRIAKQRQGPVTGWQPCGFTRRYATWEQVQ